jgi:hydroxymethylpyrimidine/phosphomethylpyrimidine kinase
VTSERPVICSIGTTHPWNVAGIGLDILVLHELGARCVSVLAGVSAQGLEGVVARTPVDAQTIAAQYAALRHAEIAAFRVGALLSAESVESVAAILERAPAAPVVCDPVVASSDGGVLADEATVDAVRAQLFRHCDVITPNLDEARLLLKATAPIEGVEAMAEAARALARFGAPAVLLKGGHARGNPVDVLYDGGTLTVFEGERVDVDLRGTGCMLACTLAFELARGTPLVPAVERARAFVREKLTHGHRFAHLRTAY